MKTSSSEFDKFDDTMRKILSVSHEELKKREEQWKRDKAKKKRAKTSPASRASSVKVFAVVETKHLLVKVTEQMKRLHANVGSRHAALEKRPEVFKRVGVYAA